MAQQLRFAYLAHSLFGMHFHQPQSWVNDPHCVGTGAQILLSFLHHVLGRIAGGNYFYRQCRSSLNRRTFWISLFQMLFKDECHVGIAYGVFRQPEICFFSHDPKLWASAN